MYNKVDIISETYEDIPSGKLRIRPFHPPTPVWRYRQKLTSTTPPSFDALSKRNPHEYPHIPYISRNQSHWSTFLPKTVWVYLHSNLCSGLQKTHFVSNGVRNRPLKVIQGRWFWYQSKDHTDSLLGRLVSMVPSCTVSEIRRLIGLKVPIFLTTLSFGALAPYVPIGISR